MEIRLAPLMSTRPCVFSLALQDDSVFADFELDNQGRLYIVRISYDGYGCCNLELESNAGVIDAKESKLLLKLVKDNDLENSEASTILRKYFRGNKERLWPEALVDCGLV